MCKRKRRMMKKADRNGKASWADMYKPVTFNGGTYKSIKELAEYYDVPYLILQKRLKSGMDIEEALTDITKKNAKVDYNGREYPSIRALAMEKNINPSQLAKYYCGDAEKAVDKVIKAKRKTVTIWGKEYKNFTTAALAFGINPASLRDMYRKGTKPIEEIVKELQDGSSRGRNGISVTYNGNVYRNHTELCRCYNISCLWVNRQEAKFKSWLDTFVFGIRLKKELGYRDDEFFAFLPGCIMQEKRYHSINALYREIGISCSKVVSYRNCKGTHGLFGTLRAMQQEKTVRQINGRRKKCRSTRNCRVTILKTGV